MSPLTFALTISVVAIVCVFSFTAVAAWSDARRKEREAFYKSETLKKIAESQGAGPAATVEFMREEARIAFQRDREKQKLGGLTTLGVGIALTAFLWGVSHHAVALVGLFPFLVGVALLLYVYVLGPKDQ